DGKQVPVRGKECSSEQNPFLLDKIETFKEFASLDMNEIYGEEKLKEAFQLTAHTFETTYFENLGDGNFQSTTLMNQAQTGPTLSLITGDFNKDGHQDIMGVGAIYEAEVETIRYDSNYGYVLLGDGQGTFVYSKDYDPFIDSNSKDVIAIDIKGKSHYIVVSNNAPLEVFRFDAQ
ncbi:MAG: VCBS repeat-containing protein, partial [Urechidicola sp.]|nr:VCBS repeat-containing protein [Urechidicola sp.]